MVELGWRPLSVTPVFSLGQDWIVTLAPMEGAVSPVYPNGTTVRADLYPNDKSLEDGPFKVWDGVVDGDLVKFHVEHDEVDDVPSRAYMRIMIVYPGTPVRDPFCWAKGRVVRDD